MLYEMDETHSSTRNSDAAATRKRRSSILKNQRAPRTPFSELEFNVATPTDTAKSRRVSFSRRMGVAEFATNEATTTWKNFYEEQNKSLESSGNDSAANGGKPSVSHIGKRIFDQQFEEVLAVDLGAALMPGSRAADFNISINNINLTQQLAALECDVDDKKVTAPQQHFELSSLTDHQSKLFSDDLTIPALGEMSSKINFNFSIMNPIGKNEDKCDDLDEIQRDLERPHNVVCPGPFREEDMSEYIEVDLNMTHVVARNEESNMSITDTIQSPKVQEVSKSNLSVSKQKKSVSDKDWAIDKENIAINPYVTPCEADNFAVNEEPDQVLVFDGKKLTIQSEKKHVPVTSIDSNMDKENFHPALILEEPVKNVPQRKTIVLNVNDDLPNFIDDPIVPQSQNFASVNTQGNKQITMFNEELSMSITQALPNKMEVASKSKTIEYENTIGNISITQAVPSNVIIEQKVQSERRKTIVYDNENGEISMTQAVSDNVLFQRPETQTKRRTTIYDDANISLTQTVPANLIVDNNAEKENVEKPNRTILYQNNVDDISFTQAVPNIIHVEEEQVVNKTTVFEKSIGNISMTQALPTNIFFNENKDVGHNKRKTIVYENDDGNISMTQAIPTNLILTDKPKGSTKRQTIVFENDTADVSITQALPAKILQQISFKSDTKSEKNLTMTSPVSKEVDEQYRTEDISINNLKSPVKKRLTIMYDEDADISMTQALPVNILSTGQSTKSDKAKTILFESDTGDISITQAIPHNILKDLCEEKLSQTLLVQKQNVSMTQVVADVSYKKSNSIVIDSENDKLCKESKHDVSNKQALEIKAENQSDFRNFSITKPIPNDIFDIENEVLKKDVEKFGDLTQIGEKTLLQETLANKSNVLVYQATTINESKVILNETGHDIQEQESNNCTDTDKRNESVKSAESNLKSVNNEVECMEEDKIAVQTNKDDINSKAKIVGSNFEVIEKENRTMPQDSKEKKKSILHELLDMSTTLEDNAVDKNAVVSVEIKPVYDASNKSESDSNDRIFVITKDSNENAETVNDHNTLVEKIVQDKHLVVNVDKVNEIETRSLPALELQSEDAMENNLEDKITDLSHRLIKENKSPQNRHYEKIVSSDLQASFKKDVMDKSDINDFANLTKTRKSFKEADDTKELLEMLSDFTDRKSYAPIKDDDENIPQIKARKSIVLEHKTEVIEPKRLSFAPNRQSIVLSREDLLHSLSMAQATLQRSRFEMDDSESIEDTATESPTELNESTASKKSVRMSNEVVKTLHFEDESFNDGSLESDVKRSPLKKTAFGETSYMKESKANVIPTYLKDVSDNIKALMNDLVKPRPDQMPFEVNTRAKKVPSTCSTQIQANLVTSSQIDLDVELHSNVNSVYELNKTESLAVDIAEIGNKAVDKALRGPVTDVSINASEMNVVNESHGRTQFESKSPLKKTAQAPVLIFDHHNPLNNVLLAPPNCSDVHKYSPGKSSEAMRSEDHLNKTNNVDNEIKDQIEVERVTTQYHVESHVGLQSGDASSDKKGDSHSLYSDPSKPLSMDRSTEGIAMEVKDTEVNTLIVMKGNKELLEASSSLTLVDDALTQSVFDVRVETQKSPQKDSPVKVIYKLDDKEGSMLENIDSDIISNEAESVDSTKAKKRNYSPTRPDTRSSTMSSLDVTPKPLSKMQKISNSPNIYNSDDRVPLEQDTDSNTDKEMKESHKKKSPRKSKGSPKHKKPGTDITVQQLITEYKITKLQQDLIENQIIEAMHDRLSASINSEIGNPRALSSCTSSKNQSETEDEKAVSVKETVSYVGSQPSRVDWQPELKEMPMKNVVEECESGVNVVAKIDMLPFMGTRECEWENSGRDTWAFRLLRSRLRLRVRLEHRHHNALRSRVRADTPVTEVAVDTVHIGNAGEKDPLGALCVRFALEAMRYECGRGCARAGGVPALLRRCAALARLALRWARAMRDARLRLAYTLTDAGDLTLKVANIPLRSVWEVSMTLELVVEDAREAAWPRAADVRVRSVLAAPRAPPAAPRALAALPHDWGHAPRTLWKIFRYLKNLTRDDDFLSL